MEFSVRLEGTGPVAGVYHRVPLIDKLHDVETADDLRASEMPEVASGGGDDVALFLLGHRVNGPCKRVLLPSLDLDEAKDVSVTGDDIQFAMRADDIAAENL